MYKMHYTMQKQEGYEIQSSGIYVNDDVHMNLHLTTWTTLTTMCIETLDLVGKNYRWDTTSTTEAACQIYQTCTG
eukprot:3115872-Amphidinium_carterae.1